MARYTYIKIFSLFFAMLFQPALLSQKTDKDVQEPPRISHLVMATPLSMLVGITIGVAHSALMHNIVLQNNLPYLIGYSGTLLATEILAIDSLVKRLGIEGFSEVYHWAALLWHIHAFIIMERLTARKERKLPIT
jgi:hypothetical protein